MLRWRCCKIVMSTRCSGRAAEYHFVPVCYVSLMYLLCSSTLTPYICCNTVRPF